jgi:hypothetical protein
MMDVDVRTDFSPALELRLEAEGKSWPLAKLGADHFFPDERCAIELGPCDARIVMTVDGDEHSWRVRLVHGAVPFERSVKIEYKRDPR